MFVCMVDGYTYQGDTPLEAITKAAVEGEFGVDSMKYAKLYRCIELTVSFTDKQKASTTTSKAPTKKPAAKKSAAK